MPWLPIALPLAVSVAAVAQADLPVLARLRATAAHGPAAVGHRGASERFPENTLAALRAAVAAGAPVVEFDVYQSRDGAFVLMHDATCDRTTNAVAKLGRSQVRVDELTLAELRALDAGAWKGAQFAGERVPTLAEALEAVFPAVPMIERKAGDANALAAELRRLDAVDRVLVQAFDWPWLEALHAAEPRLLLGALGGDPLDAALLAAARATGARLVHWNHQRIDVEMAQAVRAGGDLLCVYTVDADLALLGAAALGCDLVTTNRPERFVALRARGVLPRRVADAK